MRRLAVHVFKLFDDLRVRHARLCGKGHDIGHLVVALGDPALQVEGTDLGSARLGRGGGFNESAESSREDTFLPRGVGPTQ